MNSLLLVVTLCLTWTLTVPCDDDGLGWPAVVDADLAAYWIYRQVGTDWIKIGEVPAGTEFLSIGCPATEETYCVRAVDLAGNPSAECSPPVTYERIDCGAWDEEGTCTEWRTIGRFMHFETLEMKGGDCERNQ
jgi:hypothetical protein